MADVVLAETYTNTITSQRKLEDALNLIAWKQWTKYAKGKTPNAVDLSVILGISYNAGVISAARAQLQAEPRTIGAAPLFHDAGILGRVAEWEAASRRSARMERLGAQEAERQRRHDRELEAAERQRAAQRERAMQERDRKLAMRRKAAGKPVLGRWSIFVLDHLGVVDAIHGLDQADAMGLLSARERGEAARAMLVTAKNLASLPAIGDLTVEPQHEMARKQSAAVAASRRIANGNRISALRRQMNSKASVERMTALAG